MAQEDARTLAGTRLGQYVVDAPLAINGDCTFYAATDASSGRQVVVKQLPTDVLAYAGAVEQLRTEVRRIAALRQPHLLRVYDVFLAARQDGQKLLCAVTAPPRASLRDVLLRRGLPATDRAARYAAQLAWALHALHSIGLAHGELQPGALLFTDDGVLQIADFGIARVRAAHRRRRRGLSGEPPSPYTAPEQVQSGELTPEADIYALGAVLYELICGTPPPHANAPNQPLMPDVSTTLLTDPGMDMRPGLLQVVLRALDSRPGLRYSTVRDFAAALGRTASGHMQAPLLPSLIDDVSRTRRTSGPAKG
jgi:serine/threonine protein kinase